MNPIDYHQHNNQTKNHYTVTNNQMTASPSLTTLVHPHHHHFYGHTVTAADHQSMAHPYHHHHHHHQHHQHPVPLSSHHQHYHHVQPPSCPQTLLTSSAYSSRIENEYPVNIQTGINSTTSNDNNRCCQSCPCSNRLVTGIIITILPIAITSTLICVFMMQKTNLHLYAIYSFVIFCVAFVFPFALFFFTVVLNKLYKFYKREILANSSNNVSSLMTDSCDSESAAIASGLNISSSACIGTGTSSSLSNNHHGGTGDTAGPIMGRIIMTTANSHHLVAASPVLADHQQSTSPNNHHNHHQHHATYATSGLICYNGRAYHNPYYYQIQDGTVVALAPDNALIIEDSPPSYEMALLCPSVTHNNNSNLEECSNNAAIELIDPSQMKVILPKEMNQMKEKIVPTQSSEAPAPETSLPLETTAETQGPTAKKLENSMQTLSEITNHHQEPATTTSTEIAIPPINTTKDNDGEVTNIITTNSDDISCSSTDRSKEDMSNSTHQTTTTTSQEE